MPFAPGQSGNPSGRPKITLADGRSLKDVAREYTEDALNALVSIANDGDESAAARVSAANTILDRGWGKATQAVEVTGRDGGAVVSSVTVTFVQADKE